MDIDIKYRLDVITRLRLLQKEIKNCENNIRTLKENTTLIQKQIQLETLEKIVRELNQEIGRKNQEIGILQQKAEEKKHQKAMLLREWEDLQQELSRLAVTAGDSLPLWQKEYERV